MRIVTLGLILVLSSMGLSAQKNRKKSSGERNYFFSKNITIYEEADSLGFIRAYNKDIRKWGFIDKDTNVLIPFIYDQLSLFDKKGIAVAKQKNKSGAINRRNRIKIPFRYSDLGVFTENKTYVRKGKKYGYITRGGNEVVPFIYEEAENFCGCKLAKVAKKGLYGFINLSGREVIPPEYDAANLSYSPKDQFVLLKEDGRWAFFSCKGKKMSFFEFGDVEKTYNKTDGFGYMINGPVLVRQYNQSAYVLVEDELKYIVPFGYYPYAKPFNQYRWAIVGRIGKYGAIDEFGEIKIPLVYDSVYEVKVRSGEEFKALIVRKNDSLGLLDTNGEAITNIAYKSVEIDYYYEGDDIKEIFHLRNQENREGVVDLDGNTRIPFHYQWVDKFEGRQVAFALKNDRYGLINVDNVQKGAFVYDEYFGYHNNFYPVRAFSKYGVINEEGKETVPLNYDYLELCFYNNRKMIAGKDGKFGLIDSQNQIIIPFEYDSIFNHEIEKKKEHIVIRNNKYGIIDTLGDFIIPAEYDDLKYHSKSCICVAKDGKYGTINNKNEIQIPLLYDAVFVDNYWWSSKEDFICVKKEDKFYEISKDGKLGKEIEEKDMKKAFWYYLGDE